MIIKAILYTLLIFIFISCNLDKSSSCVFENKKFETDTLKLVYAKDGSNRFAQIASLFNLDNIDSGYAGKQIRIWLGHSLAIKQHIVILKYSSSNWVGEILTFTHPNPGISWNYFQILDHKIVTPNSGWDDFIDKINKTKILEDDFWESPNCCGSGGADGISYEFEIATPNKYSIHTFGNPSKENETGRAVLLFAKHLERELCFEYTK